MALRIETSSQLPSPVPVPAELCRYCDLEDQRTGTRSLLAEVTAENPDAALPMLGVRVKLYSKGSGKWEKSGGEAAKFGLTTTEILEVIRQLQEAGRIDMLKLLHFHIGSQLTDISGSKTQ